MLRLTFEVSPRRKRPRLNPMIPALFGALVRGDGTDYRGMPSLVCPCGCNTFIACVSFSEERIVGAYLCDGVCASCGSLVSLPTPIDYEEEKK
jgi:hypothetical protein